MPLVIDEPDIPHPPRFWWLKRLAVAYTLLVVTIVAAWIVWDRVTLHRFEAEVARLRTTGQPMLAADFAALPPVPATDDAGPLYKQASTIIFSKQQDDFDNNVNWYQRLTDGERAVLQSFPTAFPTNLQAARAARAYRRADWGHVYRSPMFATMSLGILSPLRGLANLESHSLMASHLEGDDAEAVERLRDVFHLADVIDASSHSLVEHLVACGVSAVACARIELIADELSIDAPGPRPRQVATQPSTGPAAPATRKQVKALIAELLDERAISTGLVQAMRGEQSQSLDAIHWMSTAPRSAAGRMTAAASGFDLEPLLMTLARPAYRMSGVRVSLHADQRAAAAEEPNYQAMNAALPHVEYELTHGTVLHQWSRMFERVLEPGMGRVCETQAQILTSRRVAAIRLAMRLYQIDHQDELPPSLQALVPAYLPAVPLDPFAADGRPLGYLKSVPVADFNAPVIYSVGEDGVDEGASTQPTRRYSPSQTVWEVPWARKDYVFPLKAPPLTDPPPPQSPEGVNDQNP